MDGTMLRIVTAVAMYFVLVATDAPWWLYVAFAVLVVVTAPYCLRPPAVLIGSAPATEQRNRWQHRSPDQARCG
jgi:cell division protein FtsW (lipid II flippase)